MNITAAEILLEQMESNIEWAENFGKSLEGNDRIKFFNIINFYSKRKGILYSKIGSAKLDTKIDFE